MHKNENGKKVCSNCRRELDESEFYKNKYQSDKLTNECKDCISKRQRLGSSAREENIKFRIQTTCETFSALVLQPKFALDHSTFAINDLTGKTVTFEIPLRKGIPYLKAQEFLEFAMLHVTNLADMEGEIKAIDNRPAIVITGKAGK